MKHALRSLLAVLTVAAALQAQVRLGAPFQDHMVLQRGRPVTVFGHAKPEAAVSVAIAGAEATATAAADGAFRAVLPALAAGGPHRLIVRCGDEEKALEDVLIGEVWLASGQSNMEWEMRRFADMADDIDGSADDGLRVLLVKRRTSSDPVESIEGTWTAAGPDAIRDFSTVAYCFARELRARLGVPVGIVASSWGGTRAEAWTPRAGLVDHPVLEPILGFWDQLDASYAERQAAYNVALGEWELAAKQAKDAGKEPPRKPRPPITPTDRHHYATLYNGMIAPLVPMTIAGVIWYQGESNADRGWQYRFLFPAMIESWRDAFGQGDLPFLFVQLANFESRGTWPELRESQFVTHRLLPRTGMATIVDIGESKDIHPPRKDEVARRLALWARSMCYGEELVPSGPLYSHAAIRGGEIHVYFDHVGGGLAVADGAAGFEIAGPDRVFVPAQVRVDGDHLVVRADAVAEPTAVRYAWRDDPAVSLTNADGLPASPFRTDSWPGATRKNLKP